MKGDFFDFVVYRIPEEGSEEVPAVRPTSISDKNILLFTSTPEAQEIRSKMAQIMGAVGLNEEYFDILPSKTALPEWESFMEAHHEKALIFAKVEELPRDVEHYHIYHIENGELAFAHDLEQLIQDEKDGITERRKALWLLLKSWMS